MQTNLPKHPVIPRIMYLINSSEKEHLQHQNSH